MFITRVILKHFRSISACDVALGDLTFLVGQNGAGKSNFLDALALVADALNTTLEHALRQRGGLQEVRRKSSGHPTHVGVRLEFQLSNATKGFYAFELAATKGTDYVVREECCHLHSEGAGGPDDAHFHVEHGNVKSASIGTPPTAMADRLYLANLSGFAEFRPLIEALSSMGVYNFSPGRMREWQTPDAGEHLLRDGANIASVLGRLDRQSPKAKINIEAYLQRIVPGIVQVKAERVGNKETVLFHQDVAGSKHPWKFYPTSISEGTLRALGVLVALFQDASSAPLVGIEEPESALHPAAAGILLDALRDGSERRQVIVTSHSADLLDNKDVSADEIRAVVATGGTTRIGPIDETSRSTLRDHLFTAGELLRMNQLELDADATVDAAATLNLFSRSLG
ncbi:chromosome segregation protein SMC [Bradymonadaceae bacterium TMQ3]|nr:chromosome segregation protein SMC [Bradymonadaceae bacterium TMQ3]TXC76499.1 AAA family ATPase [Bradymonadales bacterium TMQ1]